jgi:hypothetical protein
LRSGKRFEGLAYTMTDRALMPDARLRDWVQAQVVESR